MSDIVINGITYPAREQIAFPGSDGHPVVYELPENPDAVLNPTSTRPPQTKAVYNAIQDLTDRVTAPFTFKGSVATLADLPDYSGSQAASHINEAYYVTEEGYLAAWNGSAWEQAGAVMTPPLSYAVDEYGSVFASQNELYLYHKALGDCPEYTYHFDDLQKGRPNADMQELTSGYGTRNHPIPYHRSMVVEVGLTAIEPPVSLNIFLVRMVGSVMTLVRHIGFSFTYGDGVARTMNLCRYINETMDPDGLLVFFTTGDEDPTVLTDYIRVRRRREDCGLTMVPLLHPYNYNKDYFNLPTTDRSVRIPPYYATPEGKTDVVRGGMKWIYCNGRPLDAEFYDAAGEVIQTSANGFGPLDLGKAYPTCIRIPEGARTMRVAVYGFRLFGSSVWPLAADMMTDYNDCGFWYDSGHAPVGGSYIGRAIENARKLAGFTYPAGRISTRHYVFNTAGGPQKAQGIPYGSKTLNYMTSYYSYLTMIRQSSGYNYSVVPSGSNYVCGLVCVSFISECLGLMEPYKSVEWWLQNYGDKLELIDRNSVLEPGDLVVGFKYRHNKPEFDPETHQRNTDRTWILFSHVQMVIDVLWDKETGAFGGYLVAESSNVWTHIVAKPASSMLEIVTAEDLAITPNAQGAAWKLKMPLDNVPFLGTNYNFSMDRALDPLNHPERVTPPPVLGPLGDRCLIGFKANGWYNPQSFNNFYVEKEYTSITVYRESQLIAELTSDDAIDTTNFWVYNLSDLIREQGPGVYRIFAGDNQMPGQYLYPILPACEASEDCLTVTMEGVLETRDSSGALTSVGTASFDKLFFRVMPWPAVVDGFPNGTPYANYMLIKAEELWDGTKFAVPVVDGKPKYQYIIAVTGVNSDYGGVLKYFRSDYPTDQPLPSEDEKDSQDEDEDTATDEPGDTEGGGQAATSGS